WGPPWTDNSAAYFESVNRNKESVVLDLADPADLAVARRLAERADVLIENFRPGTMRRYGLGYDDVRAANPGVVYCSITGFGRTHGATRPGYDFIVQAVGGLMSITGEPADRGGKPVKVGVALVDVLTAKDAVIGILAALHARRATGQGQLVEVSLLSSLLGSLVNQASSYLTTGVAPRWMGNAHPSIAPYEALPCADGDVVIACGNDTQFRRLAAALADPGLADDERFATNPARLAHRAELAERLSALLADGTAEEWSERLNAAGVPAGKVGPVADGFALAERLGLDPLVDVGPGRPAQGRHPSSYSQTPVVRYTPPPRLGEHSSQVREWLREDEK